MRTNHSALGLVLGTIATILFAASLPMTRLAVVALDPWFVTAARGALAGLIAVAVLAVLRRPIPWADLPRLALIAACLVIGFPGLMAVAMRTVPSGHGGVILGLLPIATAVAAVFVAGERPSLFFWAMSILGAAFVVAFSMRDQLMLPVPGDLILFVSVAICSTGYAFSGTLSRRMPGWEVISWAVAISLPILLPVTLFLWPQNIGEVPWPSWAGLLYVALISQYFGFWLWNNALAMGGVARMGQIQLLQPFATLALAALLLGETIDLRMVLFATAVVVVVALGLRARVGSSERRNTGAAPAKLTVDEVAAKVRELGIQRSSEAAALVRNDRNR
jgi:drug/metabolite transporter (DMT)-like permease